MLTIRVKRPVHVGDLSEREGYGGDPVIVIETARLPLWEGQDVVEQLGTEQGGGAGDGVGEEQRSQIPIIVLAGRPVRRGEALPCPVHDFHVTVDERRGFRERRQA